MAVDTIHRAHHAGGVTFTASKGLGADGVNTPALQGLSSIAGVITSLVGAGCICTTADTVLLAPHDSKP